MSTPSLTRQDPEQRWKIARGFPRFLLTVKVRLVTAEGGEEIAGRMVDIGLGGFCAVLESELNEKKVTAEFRVPLAKDPLMLKAIVRHNQGLRYGFQFLTITPEERDVIRRGCQTLPKT